jgi:tetratricopeptide (TPR) repeat protein
MQREERQRLEQSIGRLISVNSFWSTSLNRKVAVQYLGDTKIQPKKMNKKETHEEYVIFEIYADPKCPNKPFAIIESNSAISEEQEVLFGAGAIFHLKSVRCKEQGAGYHPIWIFKMELGNEEEYELKYLFYREHYNYANDEIIPWTLSSFGLILCNLEKYKFAYKLFQRILRDRSSISLVEQARCQKIMGHISSAQHHYWESLRWYKRSLMTYATIDSNIYSAEIASIYDGIGHIYEVRKQYKRAHRSYQKSLSMWQTYYGEDQDQEEIAFCYINEADVYLKENSLAQASALSRKGLSILYQCNRNTPIHPNLASAHYLLGSVLEAMRMYDLAIDHYIESLTIASKTLSQDDSFLFAIYSDLQIACEKAERNFDQLLVDNKIRVIQDQVHIDHYNRNNGTPYQMTFRCPRCHQWQWIFTIFRPIKRFVCTGCWRKRCPRLMSYFWVLT